MNVLAFRMYSKLRSVPGLTLNHFFKSKLDLRLENSMKTTQDTSNKDSHVNTNKQTFRNHQRKVLIGTHLAIKIIKILSR